VYLSICVLLPTTAPSRLGKLFLAALRLRQAKVSWGVLEPVIDATAVCIAIEEAYEPNEHDVQFETGFDEDYSDASGYWNQYGGMDPDEDMDSDED
jgi:hypothetical protein